MRTRRLAEAVRSRRVTLGLTQQDVADLADCSERFVHSVETGKDTVRLGKVLDVLGVLGLGLSLRPGDGDLDWREPAPTDVPTSGRRRRGTAR
jgi:y4mF family transcriptional regulator